MVYTNVADTWLSTRTGDKPHAKAHGLFPHICGPSYNYYVVSFLVWQSEMVALFLRASFLCRSVMVELSGPFFLVWQSEMVALFLRASFLCRSVMMELSGPFFLVWQSEMVALFLRDSYLCRSVMMELSGPFFLVWQSEMVALFLRDSFLCRSVMMELSGPFQFGNQRWLLCFLELPLYADVWWWSYLVLSSLAIRDGCFVS